MKNKFKLIYFEGCPEAVKAKEALIKAGISDFEIILQDQLSETDEYKRYTSPTILKDDVIIFGYKMDKHSSCTFDYKTFYELDELLKLNL